MEYTYPVLDTHLSNVRLNYGDRIRVIVLLFGPVLRAYQILDDDLLLGCCAILEQILERLAE